MRDGQRIRQKLEEHKRVLENLRNMTPEGRARYALERNGFAGQFGFSQRMMTGYGPKLDLTAEREGVPS